MRAPSEVSLDSGPRGADITPASEPHSLEPPVDSCDWTRREAFDGVYDCWMRPRDDTSGARFGRYLKERRARRGQPQADRHLRSADQIRSQRSRSFGDLLGRFWRLLQGHRLKVVLSLITLTIATAIGLAMPFAIKVVVDFILAESPGPAALPAWFAEGRTRETLLWMTAGAMVTLSVLSVGIGMWGRWQTTLVTKRMQVRLRKLAFEHAVRLPLHRVHALKSGGVASILREDAGGAGEMVFSTIYNPWRGIAQLSGTLIILAFVDWLLLVGAILLLPLVWVTHKTWISRIRPMYRDIRHTRQTVDAHSTEAFGGVRIVRGFSRERGESRRFVTGNHLLARMELRTWWWARAVDMSWQLLIPLASAGILLYGGLAVLSGRLLIGDVMMFSAYLLALLSPLEALAASAASMQTNLAGFDRLLDLLDESKEFSESRGRRRVDRTSVVGSIEMRGVTFTYPGTDAPALMDVNIDVAPGEMIALVGPSGAGKTTFCNLVARFYDPDQGEVLLDGQSISEFDVESYRRILGIVEQDVFLFDGSIGENISYSRPDADEDTILAAALAANAHSFISEFPEGYRTLIGERGVRLSGGQKQRLAIARAILADPTVLILDEATSNLDSESETLIQSSLRNLMKGRTSFVIAHRLSTVRHASRIAVIEHGRIVEVGRHEELIQVDGRYAHYLRMQLHDDLPFAEGDAIPS